MTRLRSALTQTPPPHTTKEMMVVMMILLLVLVQGGWGGGGSVEALTHICKRGGADSATESLHASTIKIKLMGPGRTKSACNAAVLSGAGRSVCSIRNWTSRKVQGHRPTFGTTGSSWWGLQGCFCSSLSRQLHQPAEADGLEQLEMLFRRHTPVQSGESFSILNIPSSPHPQ